MFHCSLCCAFYCVFFLPFSLFGYYSINILLLLLDGQILPVASPSCPAGYDLLALNGSLVLLNTSHKLKNCYMLGWWRYITQQALSSDYT